MKTIATLLIASVTAISLNASANTYLNETADEAYNHNTRENSQSVITNDSSKWTPEVSFLTETADEEYSYMNSTSKQNIASVLNELDSNPPAAGRESSNKISFLTETADEEYQQ